MLSSEAEIFDYVIIGAGSAGCVLANRLSEDLNKKICLIEAGPNDTSLFIHIPMLGLPALFSHKRMNWRFMTTPQPHAGNRSMYVPRGKVLGGSSAINGMVYTRGHPDDYDDWSNAGCKGWSFAEILPYFIRSENNSNWRNSAYHGTSGPLGVADVRARNPVTKAFLDAAQFQGLPACSDFNGSDPVGAGYRQITQRNGRRASTAVAFLDPIRSRANVKIITGATAKRIVFEDRRAVGVAISVGGADRVIRAGREVILSAGAVGSPHILLLSGIGDQTGLAHHGIPVVHHLPGVGRNLQEHGTISVASRTKNTEPYGISVKVMPRLAWGLAEYLIFRRGILSSNGFEVGAFVKTEPHLSRPDIQLSLMTALPRSGVKKGAPSIQFGYGHGYSLTAVQLRPYSRGTVSLVSRNPEQAPAIDPHFLEDERDAEYLLKGLKLARRILASPSFERYKSTELVPGRDVQTDEMLRDHIRANAGFAFHPVGTCAMGQGAESVVDASLRVQGVDGLRVVDASIMPTIIGGNTNAPTIMIAEKAADMILGRNPPSKIDIGQLDRTH